MENTWEVTGTSDTQLTVDFTINDLVYTQTLLTYWQGVDADDAPISGGIRVDTPDHAREDLNAYMADYAAGIAAQEVVPEPDPLLGLTP